MRVDDLAGDAMGLADIARHVIGCALTQAVRVHKALEDVAIVATFARPWDATSLGADAASPSGRRVADVVERCRLTLSNPH